MTQLTEAQWEEHVRRLADSHCRAKHYSVYDGMITARQRDSEAPAPPCRLCIDETEKRLLDKRSKMHGRVVSPEEALRLRHEFGLADTLPDPDHPRPDQSDDN
jgi:hypothetical protein